MVAALRRKSLTMSHDLRDKGCTVMYQFVAMCQTPFGKVRRLQELQKRIVCTKSDIWPSWMHREQLDNQP
eukprot:7389238-Prymnesium_polylepis.1